MICYDFASKGHDSLCLYIADFGTGVYHWSVDNYGSGATPIVGDQIAAFQGHHQRPWTITQRQFANNLHKVCVLLCRRLQVPYMISCCTWCLLESVSSASWLCFDSPITVLKRQETCCMLLAGLWSIIAICTAFLSEARHHCSLCLESNSITCYRSSSLQYPSALFGWLPLQHSTLHRWPTASSPPSCSLCA